MSKGKLMEKSSPAAGRRVVVLRFVLAMFVLLGAGPLYAQSTFGSILGTVHDASGAAVQGAQVTLTNEGTSAIRTETTDEGGNYAFRNIDVAVYNVAITVQGFQSQTLRGIR